MAEILYPVNSMGNILREKTITYGEDFSDDNGFFFRSVDGGYVRYVPIGNRDSEYIDQDFDAQQSFVVPVVCRKILAYPLTSPSVASQIINIGYGV